MKKLIPILLLLVSAITHAQVQVAGALNTIGVASYPTHYDSLQKGGWRVVSDTFERNAIPILRRKIGMLVYAVSDTKTYRLMDLAAGSGTWTVVIYGGISKVLAGYGEVLVNDSTTRIDTSLIETRPRAVNEHNLLAPLISPGFTTPNLGTPSAGVMTNVTGLPLTTGVTGILGTANGGTNISSYTIGDLLYASTTSVLSKLAAVAAGSFLRSAGAGTAPAWSTATIPNTTVAGDIMYASATNVHSNLAKGSDGQVLTLVSGFPAWAAAGGGTVTGGSIASTGWGALFTSPTTATTPSGILTFAPALISQSAYTVFARGATSGVPSFQTMDSNFISGVHTGLYNDGRYFPLAGYTYTNTTGNAIDINAANLTTGRMINLDMTGTAAASNLKTGIVVNSVGINTNASQLVTGINVSVANTGTTNTNKALIVSATGATNNVAIDATGRVGIYSSTPSHALRITPQGSSDGIAVIGGTDPLIVIGDDLTTNYGQINWNSASDLLRIRTAADGTPIQMSASYIALINSTPFMVGTTSVDASSTFTVASTTAGVLLPRMTATQMNAIASPTNSLLVYNSDSAAYFYRVAGAWKPVGISTPVSTSATASTTAARDASANLKANAFLQNYATTITSGTTVTLTVTSAQLQYFTGSTAQLAVLPVTSTLVLGESFTLVNNSTASITVQSSGLNTIKVMAAGSRATFTVILASGTTAASWDYDYTTQGASKIVLVSNTQITNPTPTTLTDVVTYTGTIPANSIGVNGSFHILVRWGRPNNADLAAVGKVKIGASQISQISIPTSNASITGYTYISNRNAMNVQVGGPSNANGSVTFASGSGTAVSTFALDFSVDQTLTLTIANGTSGTATTVESIEVIAYY